MRHTLQVDSRPIANGETLVRLLLTLTGDAPAVPSRAPLNLALVLDRSGSMAGAPLHAAKAAAARLVRRLSPADRVSVVAFDTHITTLADAHQGDSAALLTAIEGIDSGGSTNLSGGWLMGRQLVDAARTDGAVSRIILLTDGRANRGIIDPERLRLLCATAHAAGITTTTIGFGAHYDEDLLRGMADAGHGNAWYIEQADQATDVFAQELQGLLTLCAQNVTVTMTAEPSVRLAMLHGDWPGMSPADATVRLTLGDLYPREPKQVLAELVVGADLGTGVTGVARVVVDATVLGEGGAVTQERITFPVQATLDGAMVVDPTIEREILLATVAKAREESARASERGDDDAARSIVRQARERLQQAPASRDDATLQEQLQDLRAMEMRLEERAMSAGDIKYMKQRAYNSRRGKFAMDEVIRRER